MVANPLTHPHALKSWSPRPLSQACPLLRKLLDGQGTLNRSHMALLFEAIRSAFVAPDRCAEPLLRREYMKLVGAIAGRPDLFGKAEKAHLDVYRVIGHVQNEMGTDDNFQFNKVSSMALRGLMMCLLTNWSLSRP
jgi:hypothetical protein